MPYTDRYIARKQIQKLMSVATTLADLTQSAKLTTEIPAFLARMFSLDAITLAVFHQTDSVPEFDALSSSGQIATGEAAPTFSARILEILQRTKPATLPPALRSPFVANITPPVTENGFTEIATADLPAYPGALVFSRAIDEVHHLSLILHLHTGDALPDILTLDAISFVADLLAKLLRCNLAWLGSPEILGSDFERLTDREWVVLRRLNSDDGEKQLADHLGLSPHTLHSHIKSIYRKIGVQGRLPLLQKLNAAVQELRKAAINPAPNRTPPKPCATMAG